MTFLPGLTIHTIENKTSKALLLGKEIIAKGYNSKHAWLMNNVLDFKR
jgi:hypothetical protein